MTAVANRYARALIDSLYPDHAESGLEQLQSFNALLDEEPDARRFFENPTISRDRRKRLLKEIGEAHAFDRRVSNFVNILVDRNRLEILDEIIQAYRRLLDDRLGIVRALVTSAHPLDPLQQNELAARLESVTGKQVRMEIAVDRALIGGVIAQVGSTIFDGSVRQQLQMFKQRLIEE